MAFSAIFTDKPRVVTVDEVLETFNSTLTKLQQISSQREESISANAKKINDLQDQINLDTQESTRAKAVFQKISNLLG